MIFYIEFQTISKFLTDNRKGENIIYISWQLVQCEQIEFKCNKMCIIRITKFNVKISIQYYYIIFAPLTIILFRILKSYIRVKYLLDNMIQVVNCQVCNISYPIQQMMQHKFYCRANRQSTQESRKSIQLNNWKKIKLNAELIKQYCRIDALEKEIDRYINKTITSNFTNQIKDYKLALSEEWCEVNVQLSPKLGNSQYILGQLKEQLQQYLNSFQIISFNLNEDYHKSLDLLKNKYIFQVVKTQIIFIARKSQILYNVTKFFQNVISLTKTNRKFAIHSELVEFEIEKAKQVQEAIKSIHLLIAGPDQVSIRQKNDRACLVFISGEEETVSICKDHITNIIIGDSLEHCCKRFKVTQQQAKLLEKQKVLEKLTQQYGVKFQLKTFNIVRQHKISSNSKIYLLANSSLLYFPRQTVIILPQNQTKEIKQLSDLAQIFKDYFLYDCQENKTVVEMVKQFVELYVVQSVEIGIVLPDATRQLFIQTIINTISSLNKTVNIYFLEKVDQRLAIEAFENAVSMQKKWYAMVRGTKKFYPESVCKKIQQAIAGNRQTVIVASDELKIQKITHKYDGKETINHIQNGNSNYVQDQDDKLIVFVQDHFFQVNKKNINTHLLTFCVFQLNLIDNTQTNLITHKISNINYEFAKKAKIQDSLSLQKPQIEITIKYPDQQSINKIWNKMRNFLNEAAIQKQISIQNFTQTQVWQIKNWCKLNKVQIKVEGKSIEVKSYNKMNIVNLQKLIEIHVKKLQRIKIQYPPYWEHNINQPVSLRNVDEHSEEFKKVQNLFKVGAIKKLQRIQNNILYQKYNSEKAYLSQINGGEIRQLLLYHGTRGNKPESIYDDRDESFNINYANLGSHGKGIYFAKNSEYSHNYCYTDRRLKVKQMFYCLVLIGHSQVFKGETNKLDTNYRDAAKKIRYESVVNAASEDIVVVFKNRRAYPLYLISY